MSWYSSIKNYIYNVRHFKSSLHAQLDNRMVVHVLGGSWANIQSLKGNSLINTQQYLRDYLSEYSSQLPINIDFQLTKKITEELSNFNALDVQIDLKIDQPISEYKQRSNIINIITDAVENLAKDPTNQRTIVIPGGWNGLPKDPINGYKKHDGHAMYYTIKKDPQNPGRFIFSVINGGSGVERYHPYKYTNTGKQIYSPTIKWDNLTKEQITNNDMLSNLVDAMIIPLRSSFVDIKKENRPFYTYDASNVYKTLNKYLPLDNKLEATDWITPQRIGNCSWKSLMLVMREQTGVNQYKIFINDLKLITLQTLFDNLSKNHNYYGKHQFLMIKALLYGTKKLAKTLNKRKELFSSEIFEKKFKQIKQLSTQAEKLYNNYLKTKHGELTQKNLPNNLNQLITEDPSSRQQDIQNIIKLKMTTIPTRIVTKPLISQKKITIFKVNKDSHQPLLDLKECLNYAKVIKNPQTLRAFLTKNVFDHLPNPPDVFYTNMPKKDLLAYLFTLYEMLKLYNTTAIQLTEFDLADAVTLPEHGYNYAKILGIGKYVTKLYTQTTETFKELITNDVFSLPNNFNNIFLEDGLSLDPYTCNILWKQLKSQPFTTFSEKILFENTVINFENVFEYKEIQLFLALDNNDDFTLKTIQHGINAKPDEFDPDFNAYLKARQAFLAFRNKLSMRVLKTIQHAMNTIPDDEFQDGMEAKNVEQFIAILREINISFKYLSHHENPFYLNNNIIEHVVQLHDTGNDHKYFFQYPRDTLGIRGIVYPLHNAKNNFIFRCLMEQKQESDNEEELFDQAKIILNPRLDYRSSYGRDAPFDIETTYHLKLIVNAPRKEGSTNQITLLLDYFESLSKEQQNHFHADVNLANFFKQIVLSNINYSIKQIKDHELLAIRLIDFFNEELTKPLSIKNLHEQISRYVDFQRTAHKVYSFLKYSTLEQSPEHIKKFQVQLEHILTISRTNLLNYLRQKEPVDRGKIAAYGLASFGHLYEETNTLTIEELEQALIFSTNVGIYGFGKDTEYHDLLFKKDIYDVRLKIAEQIQTYDQSVRNRLLNLCLINNGINIVNLELNNLDWQESDPYYSAYDANNNLIQINLFTGIILKNEAQIVVNNIPDNILHSLEYQQMFGSESIEVITDENVFMPQKSSLKNLKILQNKSNLSQISIIWEPSVKEKYVFLSVDDINAYSINHPLNLPSSFKIEDFTFWAKITENSEEYEILIAPKAMTQEPKPCFKILQDGRVVKLTDDNLSLAANNIDNTNLLDFATNLGVHPENILTWQNKAGIITKIEFPLGDNNGEWLSFELKQQNGVTNWHWTKDPSYYISSKQILKGRPSISNFILLENDNGNQKALFTNTLEKDLVKHTHQQPKLKSLHEIYQAASGKPATTYLEVDIKQSPERLQAELIPSPQYGDIVNLYIAYLNIMHPEGDPVEACKLLNKQRPLRSYTKEELSMLQQIIESGEEQLNLEREDLHPDTMVAKLLAIYLIEFNLIQYPNLENDISVKSFKDRANEFYQDMVRLPKSSDSGNLGNFISSQDLKMFFDLNNISPEIIKHKPKCEPLRKPKGIFSIMTLEKDLNQQHIDIINVEQKICQKLNDLLILHGLELQTISGEKRILTIEDAIYLYLKQDVSLWKEYTGLTDINEIHTIQDEIIKYLSLKVNNTNPQRDYDYIKYPLFLVYEALAGITLRPKQIEKLKQLLTEENEQIELQLEIVMGMGKSKVLSPLLSHIKADGNHLSILVLTEPLYSSGSSDLQKSLGLINTRVETIEFSRQKTSLEQIKMLKRQLERIIEEGVVCTARVKDLQCIASMPEVLLEELHQSIKANTFTESTYNEQLEKIQILLEINNIIKEKGLFTLDELDTQLYSRHQLNLPIGNETSISLLGTQVATELFLMLMNNSEIKQLLIDNHQTFLTINDFEKIKLELANQIFDKLFLNNCLNIDKEELKQYFMAYVGAIKDQPNDAKKFYDILNKLDNSKELDNKILVDKIAMYKMQLSDGKLQDALNKCSNVQFGRSKLQPKLEIVIPYAASNSPKESSFFKDPWETVNKTIVYYISTSWHDLEQTKQFVIFLRSNLELLKDLTIFTPDIVELLKNDNDYILNNVELLTKIMHSIESLRKSGNVNLFSLLFQYLKTAVFPEQIKSYQIQASNTSQDFAAQPKKLNGYSGTRRGEDTWHNRLIRDDNQGVDTNIHNKLLDPLDPNFCFSDIDTSNLTELINYFKQIQSINLENYSSFIDAGALFKDLSNIEVAKILLQNLPHKEAIIFYHEVSPGNIKLALITRKNLLSPTILDGSDVKQIAKALGENTDFTNEEQLKEQLGKKIFNFYDQSHIIGSDLPNTEQGRAFMTFNEQLGKDLMNQGVMRMRKFMEKDKQHVDFLVPKEVKKIILSNLNLLEDQDLTINHLINHAILTQENQEKQDYYDALHQKIQHIVKEYLTTQIRKLLLNNKSENALTLYEKSRDFMLFLEEKNLFKKYGAITTTINPIEALQQTVKNLKASLTHKLSHFIDLNLDSLNLQLDEIIQDLEITKLPIKVSSNAEINGNGGEVSTEQQSEAETQQEQQQQQEQQPEQQKLYPSTDFILGQNIFTESYKEYLSTLEFDTIENVSLALEQKVQKSILNPIVQKKWKDYYNFIEPTKDNIFYSEDAFRVFTKIDPIEGLFTKYSSPIHQVLIVEDPDQIPTIKLIVLSTQESVNFVNIISKAKQEDNFFQNKKMWLVSTNGEALEGTHPWKNPFKNISKDTEILRTLLLQMLVLQKNVGVLSKLLKQNTIFKDWFETNKDLIKTIFNDHEKFSKLIDIKTNHMIIKDNNAVLPVDNICKHFEKLEQEFSTIATEATGAIDAVEEIKAMILNFKLWF